MERKDSLRKMVDWIIDELKENGSIEIDENNQVISRSYFHGTCVSGFTVEDLEKKN